ncbi:MAG: aminoacyl-histidine dipeptidase [Bacteroidales bacterium]|nr:aminoacyl-histidine dipeptidase [Bacteroidales bacterium]
MEIKHLEPQLLWKFFHDLVSIPRPSGHEAKAVEYVKQFGERLGLKTHVDDVGNVIIKKPASPGMENRKGVILQGHLDIVPQKNSDTDHDFEKDPIDAYVDGEWVTARGTTLGSDNGIGVAAALAILESKDIPHGPVEGLFTVDEETGMTGAFHLKPGLLDGHILLNMDSEDEGELYIGCAGGTNANMKFRYQQEPVPSDHVALRIKVVGLKGGHSGLDIGIGRGNSNKVLFRYLRHAAGKHGVRMSSVDGGNLRNAIPRESFAVITVPMANKEKLLECIREFEQTVKAELKVTEPDLRITAEETGKPTFVMDSATQESLILSVYGCPNGVIRMNDSMPGLVETSTNLAIVKSGNGEVKVQCLLRSSVDSAKEDLEHMVASVFSLAGAEVVMDGQYPGWKPNPESEILGIMKDVYNRKWGKIPQVKAIHAGLECGILGSAYPGWDMISFGPTIRYPHSPDEKVHIGTVARFWEFLVETLRAVPAVK